MPPFAKRTGAEPGESHSDAGEQDIVVTATTSGTRCCAATGCAQARSSARWARTRPNARELDDLVLQRAAFVCCDSLEQARIESGDLIEPVEHGVLDWLEVHELQEVVAGETEGRQSDADIVVFKSNGLAAWDVAIGALAVERALEAGVGTQV